MSHMFEDYNNNNNNILFMQLYMRLSELVLMKYVHVSS